MGRVQPVPAPRFRGARGAVLRSGTSGLSQRSERGKRSAEQGPTAAAPLYGAGPSVIEALERPKLSEPAGSYGRAWPSGGGAEASEPQASETERSRSEFRASA